MTSSLNAAYAQASQCVYASPTVRRAGRELGVDLVKVQGSGRGGRILKEDVYQWVRERLQDAAASMSCAPSWPALPAVDFAKFGEIERRPLSSIRRISALVLARNWATIPDLTNFDEADITELEQFRVSLNQERRDETKITVLSFLVKACASALKSTPAFNAWLDGQESILKKYIHIGVAVDTPVGLFVLVLRNADQLSLRDIASRIAAKAALAREGNLKTEDMEGGGFSISSLGGIGGRAFTTERRPVAWAFEREDGGRAFTFTGLHYLVSLDNPALRRLLLNAIFWTAKIDIPEAGVRTAAPVDAAERLVKQEVEVFCDPHAAHR